jgi:hypothetical protein
MSRILIVSGIMATILLAGCGNAPTEQVAAAQQAMEVARAAEADKYAPEEFSAAQNAFSQATDEIKAQDDAFFLSRSYDNADQLLDESLAQLEAAKTAAVANKEIVKKEVEVLTTETEAAIETAKSALAKAPRGKDSREALEAMKADLEAAIAAVAEAREIYSKGDYIAAKTSLTQSMEKATTLSGEVEQAMQKVRGARR